MKFNIGAISKEKDKSQNPEKIHKELCKILSNLDKKLVIIIDNLDRLDSSELFLIFKLVRLCSDFPNFVFILAFDREQVRKLIELQHVDSDFLEKIIQIDIELPIIDQNDIDSFVISNLDKLFSEISLRIPRGTKESFFDFYYQAISNYLIKDLRSAKRYLNSVVFSIPLVMEEVDIADFLILEVLRVFYPMIYAKLPGYKKELTDFEFGSMDGYLRTQRLELKKGLREWISRELPNKKEAQNWEKLIGFLFPSFGAYITNPTNPSNFYLRDEYMAHQRICADQFFDTYFKFKIPDGGIPNRVFFLIEDSLNNEDTVNIDQIIPEFYREDEKLFTLFSKLFYHIRNINNQGRIRLIQLLASMGHTLNWNLLSVWDSSGAEAVRLVIKCIEGNEYNREIIEAISSLITFSGSLPMASEIFNRLQSVEYPVRI